MQTYYVNLQTTKELRATVYGDVKALDDLMTQYHEAYKDFRKTISVEEEKRANDAN